MRRGKKEIARIQVAIYNLLKNENPMTVRQVFYRLVSTGIIEKTESEYKSTVVRLLGRMRKQQIVPYYWISDNTRWVRRPQTYSSMERALQNTAESYRRSLWQDLDTYVEFWLEKDSLSGIVYKETESWDVPLMVTRGYPSLSFLYTAGEQISLIDKSCYLYYMGDHDPSGVNIPIKVEEGIREFAPNVDLHFEVIAVTTDQIVEYDLPTRPTKQSDSRSIDFIGESVELDAIPPSKLREIVRERIRRHISTEQVERIKNIEKLEKESVQNYIDLLASGL